MFLKILPGQWQEREESFRAPLGICCVHQQCQCCGLVRSALSNPPAPACSCSQLSARWPHPAFPSGRAGAGHWHRAFNLARQRWPQGGDKTWLLGTLRGGLHAAPSGCRQSHCSPAALICRHRQPPHQGAGSRSLWKCQRAASRVPQLCKPPLLVGYVFLLLCHCACSNLLHLQLAPPGRLRDRAPPGTEKHRLSL